MQKYNPANRRIGAQCELAFFNAFAVRDSKAPPWLLGIKRASTLEDIHGIDAFAETTRGRIGIQIKSSHQGVMDYLATHPGTKVIAFVIWYEMHPDEIRHKTYQRVRESWIARTPQERLIRQ